nr:hypothetical protein [[Eubacterium] tenue]
MADKEFRVKISAETDDFSRGMNRAEDDAYGLGSTLKGDVSTGAKKATDSLKETTEELRRLQREAIGAKASVGGVGNSFDSTYGQSTKFNREMQRLSMILGGDVPESTKQAYAELAKLHREARTASRLYGKYSMEAMNARDAINTFALGLDDTTFKQIYMRSQLGLTDMQLRQQANSIKLNARMTKLMGNQTQILMQRMQGLAKYGIKPEDLLPPSTIGQFQLLNETMAAGQAPISRLSGAYRKFGASMDKTIKGWSAQKMAIKAAQGDMVKYGLLMRGITTGLVSMTMALPLVGMGAFFAYKTMFKSALEADGALKKLAETTQGKVAKAFEPVIQAAGKFLEIAFKVTGVVADWITKFNETHPIIAKVAGAIGFLMPAMTLLLLPLGLGLGLFNGWKLVLGAVWPLISGVVALIGTASATFLTFAVVIGTVVAAFMYLWKTNEGFREACIGIWEAIKTTIQMALESIQQFFITHGDTIKLVLQTAYETLKNIIMTIMTAIGEVVKLILDSIKQFWNQHGQTIMQAVKTIYETIKTIVTSYLEALSDFIKIILDNIKQFWDKHGESLKQVAKSAWDMIKTIISNVLKVIQSIILAVSSAINGDWDTFWQQMGNIVKIAWDTICNLVKFAIQNIPRIISAGAGLVVSAMKSLLQGTVNAAKSFGTTMLNVGKDLIKGLANGIKAGASWVVDSITNAVKGAINAGKKLLGINSPSKLFMQFGEWTTEGYQIGVDRGEPKSTRAVENFANNSIEAFSTNALPQEGSLNNSSVDNSTYNININAGALNNEQDLYKLAEIIDRKLLEIKQRNSKMFGGYQRA